MIRQFNWINTIVRYSFILILCKELTFMMIRFKLKQINC